MNTEAVTSPTHENWKELYKAALFEADKNKLSERIAVAEWALVVRARELFYADEEHALQEWLAVDAAMYALRVLRGTKPIGEGRKGMHRVQAA